MKINEAFIKRKYLTIEHIKYFLNDIEFCIVFKKNVQFTQMLKYISVFILIRKMCVYYVVSG